MDADEAREYWETLFVVEQSQFFSEQEEAREQAQRAEADRERLREENRQAEARIQAERDTAKAAILAARDRATAQMVSLESIVQWAAPFYALADATGPALPIRAPRRLLEREAAAAAGAPLPASPASLELTQHGQLSLATLTPPQSREISGLAPTCGAHCLVIDVSYSMEAAATVKSVEGDSIDHGFSMLDIAKVRPPPATPSPHLASHQPPQPPTSHTSHLTIPYHTHLTTITYHTYHHTFPHTFPHHTTHLTTIPYHTPHHTLPHTSPHLTPHLRHTARMLPSLSSSQHAMRTYVASLSDGDFVCVACYATNSRMVIEWTACTDDGKDALFAAIDSLKEEGSTNLVCLPRTRGLSLRHRTSSSQAMPRSHAAPLTRHGTSSSQAMPRSHAAPLTRCRSSSSQRPALIVHPPCLATPHAVP